MSGTLNKLEMITMNGKEESVTLYDTDLINHTNKIDTFRKAGNMAIINIAYELGEIDKTECYKKAGFKNVAEYANILFDYKRPTTALYVRVARAFLTYNEEEGYATIKGDVLPKLTVGQMIELLPLVKEDDITEVEKAFINGDLNQRMSTKKLRDSVKSLTAIETTSKEINETKEETNRNQTSATPIDRANSLYDTILDSLDKVVTMTSDLQLGEVELNKISDIVNSITELKMQLSK